MGKPIIGIAANEVQDAGDVLHHLPIAYTPLGYVRAIQQAGGLPLLLPISEPAIAKDYVSQIDKLVLAGGQDVSPKFYGQEAHQATGSGFLARDEFELALIDEALLQKKPIFAVCRGMQLVNVAFGARCSKTSVPSVRSFICRRRFRKKCRPMPSRRLKKACWLVYTVKKQRSIPFIIKRWIDWLVHCKRQLGVLMASLKALNTWVSACWRFSGILTLPMMRFYKNKRFSSMSLMCCKK